MVRGPAHDLDTARSSFWAVLDPGRLRNGQSTRRPERVLQVQCNGSPKVKRRAFAVVKCQGFTAVCGLGKQSPSLFSPI